MPEIDAEAAGILIENGVDVPTALAGSLVEEAPGPTPPSHRSKLAFWLAFVAGLVAAAAWRGLF
ncbi:MAG TPA: hypothetical protein VHD36_17380 [Pirellulales bacterium]|nr:hypothetical protein [Pirellulales bacterium]